MDEKNYVNNQELLEEIKLFKKTCKYDENKKYIKGSGKISEKLGKMLLLIAKGLITKPNFIGYSLEWKQDMVSEGLLAVCKYLHNFDIEKSNNAFSYITQYFYNANIAYIKKQKNHSYIKDTLFLKQDMLSENGCIDYEQFRDYKCPIPEENQE